MSASEDRHNHITDHLNEAQRTGLIEHWTYERAAQRYMVTLEDEYTVMGGESETRTLIMTLMTTEAFLVGLAVAYEHGRRERARADSAIRVDPEGVAHVQQ